jgi:hypothetical protein
MAIDDLQLHPGVDVDAERIAKPLVHELIVGCLDGRADDENDIVQFGIALGGSPAEIGCE